MSPVPVPVQCDIGISAAARTAHAVTERQRIRAKPQCIAALTNPARVSRLATFVAFLLVQSAACERSRFHTLGNLEWTLCENKWRRTMVMRAVICKGDPTSHGGEVLEGNPRATANGHPIALKGHMTRCPQCQGDFPIVDGLGFHSFAGIGTAVEGMKTACGAVLIAKAAKGFMMIDDRSEAEASAVASAAQARRAERRFLPRSRQEHRQAGAGYALSYRAARWFRLARRDGCRRLHRARDWPRPCHCQAALGIRSGGRGQVRAAQPR